MMVRKSIYLSVLLILNVLFLLTPTVANAQRRPSLPKVKEDSIPFFRGVAVGVDLVGPAMRWLASYGQYEGMVRVNLKDRYYPVIEVGVGQADKTDETTGTTFKTTAPYGRVGCDFNMLKDKHDAYRFLVGGRVGYTSFKYDVLSPGILDPIWGTQSTYGNLGNKGRQLWAELVGGVDAKIWGPIRMGWSVRYKLRLARKMSEIGEPWYVPGYGRSGSSQLGATFNVLFEL
ncbi:MAG: hypothetical protein HXN33_01515 [Prevotella histicola]|uniref:Uncharacterized protein n=1 Tax=Prevotella histicola TaxID=470565 RepID=A0A930HWM0_9BACT|nr:hypothetical protein [Prevotella histicola]